MRFALDDEQAAFAAVVRRFFTEQAPLPQVRRAMVTADGFDRALWRRMAEQLGLPGLAVPEEHGGAGLGPVELGIALREAGRALSPAPLFASAALATAVLLCADDERAAKRWLPGLAAGEVIATVAVAADAAQWSLAADGVTARAVDGGWRLRGRRRFVLHGHVADLVLVSTATPGGGSSLFAVAGDAGGLRRTVEPTLDPTRTQATVDFDDVAAEPVGPPGGARTGLERAMDLGAVALAQEQVGGAERCLDMAVAYAQERHQFGHPIGSFQAIKHLLADVFVEIEAARAAADYAALVAATAPDQLPLVASLARAACTDAFRLAAGQNIQVHGGIGFTWEHDAHLYFKRATTTAHHLGSPAAHRERVAGIVLDGGVAPAAGPGYPPQSNSVQE